MIKKDIIKRFQEMSKGHERALYQEYVIFCNYATNKQFENFLKDKLNYKDFTDLASFFVEKRCFLLLSRLLRYHRDTYSKANVNVIKKMKLRKDIQKRFKRFFM